jgi:hypothetical protein
MRVHPWPPPRCIIYIVRRTQLYLDDELWTLLHTLSRQSKKTISDLVRDAVRSKYGIARRKEAFENVIGLWKDRPDIGEDYIRKLRGGSRLEKLVR